MKLKHLLGTLLSLVVTITVSAETGQKFTGSLLWKISGKGLEKPSYIVGTHHLVSTNFIDSINGLRVAMDATQQVVGEIALLDMMALQTKMQEAAPMPAGESYAKLLSEADFAKLNEGLKDFFGAGLEQFGAMSPGMLSMLYSITMMNKVYPNFNPMTHEAIDVYLQKDATQKGKPVVGLETVEDQIRVLFKSEPLKKQAEDLTCGISHFDFNKELIILLTQLYKSGKLQEMYDLSFNNPKNPCPTSEKQQNALAKERNDKWLEQLPRVMNNTPSLIAVGALHLAGNEGLLFQLSEMGYIVEAVL